MMHRLFVPSLGVGVLALAFLGCNTLLDNQLGTPRLDEEAGTPPEPAAGQPGPVDRPADPSGDAGETPSSSGCPVGQQVCFGTCVSTTDPLYGCGDPGCGPCSSTHGTMACQGRQCIVSACEPGYSDCNAKGADGCEVDLSRAATCGSCNAACGTAAPLCAPSGPSFQCTNGCTPGAPLACGAECVDPQTSVNDCGGCNLKCAVVANAITACNAGVCAFACKVQFHACGGACASRTDPASCGAACTPCPVPVGGSATCVNDTCGAKCHGQSTLCGGKCVGDSAFAADPLNCGACGKSCAGQACVKGKCVAP